MQRVTGCKNQKVTVSVPVWLSVARFFWAPRSRTEVATEKHLKCRAKTVNKTSVHKLFGSAQTAQYITGLKRIPSSHTKTRSAHQEMEKARGEGIRTLYSVFYVLLSVLCLLLSFPPSLLPSFPHPFSPVLSLLRARSPSRSLSLSLFVFIFLFLSLSLSFSTSLSLSLCRSPPSSSSALLSASLVPPLSSPALLPYSFSPWFPPSFSRIASNVHAQNALTTAWASSARHSLAPEDRNRLLNRILASTDNHNTFIRLASDHRSRPPSLVCWVCMCCRTKNAAADPRSCQACSAKHVVQTVTHQTSIGPLLAAV